jgi:3-oxoacyl-(acyl-carrier-protein) synthase
MRQRVVITGLGVVSAAGVGAEAFWKGLTTGGLGLMPAAADLAVAGVHVVGAVRDLSGAAYLRNERQARVLNRSFELLVAAGALAAADAGLASIPVTPTRLGVTVGIGPIEQHTPDLLAAIRQATTDRGPDAGRFAESARLLHPLRRLRLLPNVGPAILSIEHQAMGPSLTLVSGHTSGIQAIAVGAAMIREGRLDAAICGGVDARLTPLGLKVFSLLCAISPSRDPASASRPFDRARDGVTPGEGAAILVLESEDSARARGATPYAELAGYGSAGPTEGGCAESMRRAMASTGQGPDVVIAHGDGSVRSDRLEAAALDLIAPRCITSIQPATGHTMSACGALNLAAACLVLADERVPPIRSLGSPEMTLPFARHEVRGRFQSVLVNAIEPDNAAASALVTRL